MNTKISKSIFLQMMILLLISLVIFYISSLSIDLSLISLALLFSLIAFSYFLYIRKKAKLNKNSFSLTLLFMISYFIVFFQLPLDFLRGSFSDRSFYVTIVYDESILVKSIWYAVCFLISFCLGMHFQTLKLNKYKQKVIYTKRYYEKPFIYLFYLFFLLHVLTVDLRYYLGQASEIPQGIAGSILGYFIILFPICFGVIIYNAKINDNFKNLNLLVYVRIFPLPFLLILLAFSLFTFLAGDRGPAIRALLLLVGGYYILTNKKLSYFKFVLMILIAGFFLSTIKLIGSINYNENLVESFLYASEILVNSSRTESVSPFTLELASSFRAYNTAFSLWYSGFSLYGLGVLVGLLTSIPYAVTIFMQAFGLSNVDVNSSNTITEYVGETYGLGTTIIGDSLLNIGFVPTLFIAFFIGRIFLKIDYHFFVRSGNVYIYVIGMYFLMKSVGLVRASIFPTVGNVIFMIFIIFIVNSLSIKFSKNR